MSPGSVGWLVSGSGKGQVAVVAKWDAQGNGGGVNPLISGSNLERQATVGQHCGRSFSIHWSEINGSDPILCLVCFHGCAGHLKVNPHERPGESFVHGS